MEVGKDLNTETNCTIERQAFSIENSPIAFEILSTRLYSNPKMAIIRELLTNAYDAHVEAGTLDTPIEVYAPNYYDPTLTIRDHGTGLSEEDIFGMYSTFFASNKRDSNKLTGGFGLGSKTPFAYTSSFIVSSYYNGLKSTYGVTTIDGFPNIMKVASIETDEDNGLEIKIPILETDVQAFMNTIVEYLKYIPEINVIANIPTPKPKTLLKIGNITFYEYQYYDPVVYIKHGQNIFVLDNKYHIAKELVTNTAIVIETPIGTIDVTPSREGLHFTNKTIETVTQLVEPIEKIVLNLALTDSEISFVNTEVRTKLKNQELVTILRNNKKIEPYIELTEGTQLFTRYSNPSANLIDILGEIVNIYEGNGYRRALVEKNFQTSLENFIFDFDGSYRNEVANTSRWADEKITYITSSSHNVVSKRTFYAAIHLIKEYQAFLGYPTRLRSAFNYIKKYENIDTTPLLAREKSILHHIQWIGHSFILGDKYRRGTLNDIMQTTKKYNGFPIMVPEEHALKLGGVFSAVINAKLHVDHPLIKELNDYFNEINNLTENPINYLADAFSLNMVVIKNSNKRLIERAYDIVCVSYDRVTEIIKSHVKPIVYPIDRKIFINFNSDYEILLEKATKQEKLLLLNSPNRKRIEIYNNIINQMRYEPIVQRIYSPVEVITFPLTLNATLKRLALLFKAPNCYQRTKRTNRLTFIQKLITPMDYRYIDIEGE